MYEASSEAVPRLRGPRPPGAVDRRTVVGGMLADNQEVLEASGRPVVRVSGAQPFRCPAKEILCQRDATSCRLGLAPLAWARYPTPRGSGPAAPTESELSRLVSFLPGGDNT